MQPVQQVHGLGTLLGVGQPVHSTLLQLNQQYLAALIGLSVEGFYISGISTLEFDEFVFRQQFVAPDEHSSEVISNSTCDL